MLFELLLLILLVLVVAVLRRINEDYYILSLCKRFKTVDGSPIESKAVIIPGGTIFGNNLDVVGSTTVSIFQFGRKWAKFAKGKSYLLYFISAPVYNATNAEDAEEIFQNPTFIPKSMAYGIIQPFLGMGLLISSDSLWHSRRKLLTPAFHFNILTSFIEIFKEESQRFIENLRKQQQDVITIKAHIPEFTLNTICETAMGVKLNNIPGSDEYRKTTQSLESIFIKRFCNPIMYYDWVNFFFGKYFEQRKLLGIAHRFSSEIIKRKRQEFLARRKGGDVSAEAESR